MKKPAHVVSNKCFFSRIVHFKAFPTVYFSLLALRLRSFWNYEIAYNYLFSDYYFPHFKFSNIRQHFSIFHFSLNKCFPFLSLNLLFRSRSENCSLFFFFAFFSFSHPFWSYSETFDRLCDVSWCFLNKKLISP